MKKLNEEIFNLLAEPKMFDATIELMSSFEEFKDELFSQFWRKLYENIVRKVKDNDWIVINDGSDLSDASTISIHYSKDKKTILTYQLYCSLSEFSYGIGFDDGLVDFELLYKGTENFKDYGWNLGNPKFRTMPIWYKIKEMNLRDNLTYKKLLSSNVEITIEDIAETFLDDFTADIKKYILIHLKRYKIV